MSETLPKCWVTATIDEIAALNMGQSPSSDTYNEAGDGLPFFQGKAEFGKLYPTVRKWCSSPVKVAELDDILMSIRAPVGPTNLAPQKVCIGRGLAAIRGYNGIEQKYLFYYFRNIESWLSEQGTGTTFKAISGDFIKKIEFVMAPQNEQKRIADKLDQLLAAVDSCKTRLDTIPGIIKRFRQSVLAAATSGELTADWREKQPLQTSPYQGRLQIKSLPPVKGGLRGVGFKAVNNQNDRSDAVLEDLAEDFSCGAESDLPSGWRHVNLSQVATSRLGKMLDKTKNIGTPTSYLRNVNVRWFDFDLSDILKIKVSETEVRDLSIRNGDVLICEGGEPGRCAVWRKNKNDYVYQKALHRVRVGNDLIPEWLCYCLKDAADFGKLADLFTGTTIKHLTGVALRTFEFLLPPLSEQQEIVRRVEALFAVADNIEARYQTARTQVGQLTPSLLAKAFRGELVPQDPNDEPAEKLLERIRGAKDVTPVKRQSKRKGGQT